MKLIAAKKWSKVFYENGEQYRIDVIADLVHRDGNSNAYFGIGGDVFRLAKNGRKVHCFGGCIHDDIVKHFPELQPLVDIHLADEDGVPMHAYENAAYWAGQTKYESGDLGTLEKHLRVTKEQALWLTARTQIFVKGYGYKPAKAWEEVLEGQLNIWKQQAQEAKAMLNITEEAK